MAPVPSSKYSVMPISAVCMKEQFHKQHGLQQDSIKIIFISLIIFPIAATTLTFITQIISAGYTKYGKLIVIDVYKLQSTSFSACSHITISSSCGRQFTFAVHG
jgi:hypothetical protein